MGPPMSSPASGMRLTPISVATAEAAPPARKSSESPGRKNPASRPVSANRMAHTPNSANGPKSPSQAFGLSGLNARKSAMAWLFEAVSTAVQRTCPGPASRRPATLPPACLPTAGNYRGSYRYVPVGGLRRLPVPVQRRTRRGHLDLQQAGLVAVGFLGRPAAADAE